MPLARYFVYVGGVLLALLLICSAYLPASPEMVSASADLPVIRIHSERKWPERIVFDTKIRPAAPVQTAKAEAVAPAPSPAPVLETSAKVRVRDAFAQLPFDPKLAQSSDPKKPEPKLPPKRKVAKRHVAPPTVLVAQQPQQPQFGFFANNNWSPQFTR
jgi:hypothetical protein